MTPPSAARSLYLLRVLSERNERREQVLVTRFSPQSRRVVAAPRRRRGDRLGMQERGYRFSPIDSSGRSTDLTYRASSPASEMRKKANEVVQERDSTSELYRQDKDHSGQGVSCLGTHGAKQDVVKTRK
jgi:hypothetical protein